VQALLFWETRRVRVIAAKVAVLSAVAAAFVVLGQLLTIAGTRLVPSHQGRPMATQVTCGRTSSARSRAGCSSQR